MNEIILHIPHSGMIFPNLFWNFVCVDKKVIEYFNLVMTDLFTDELYGNNEYKKVVAPYSRVYCDTERFYDSNLEIMAKCGMGYVYTKTNNGKVFINPPAEYKNDILNNYYLPLHRKLDSLVEASLINDKTTILVDCHSFSLHTVMDENRKKNLPDICIGFNKKYFSKKLVEFIKSYFEDYGYTVMFNYPYDGAMVPDKYLSGRADRLYCVMIEINKNNYLTGFNKNGNFLPLQKLINELFNKLKYLELSN